MEQFDLYWYEFQKEEDRGKKVKGSVGRHPALVLKPDIMVQVAKITGAEHGQRSEFDYVIKDYKAAGLTKPSIIRFDKTILVGKSQLTDYIGHLSEEDIKAIQKITPIRELITSSLHKKNWHTPETLNEESVVDYTTYGYTPEECKAIKKLKAKYPNAVVPKIDPDNGLCIYPADFVADWDYIENLTEELNRDYMIAELEKAGKHYNWSKYKDSQIWYMYQREVVNKKPQPKLDSPQYCEKCGLQLTDSGECPRCDLEDPELQ